MSIFDISVGEQSIAEDFLEGVPSSSDEPDL
jgi:hypothetical protein